jgi:hypothetical protein
VNWYFRTYLFACGLWFPIVLNNWLGFSFTYVRTIPTFIVYFVLGALWTMIYCRWWAGEEAKIDEEEKRQKDATKIEKV